MDSFHRQQYSLKAIFVLTALMALHCWLAVRGGVEALAAGLLWTLAGLALYLGWRWAFFGASAWPRGVGGIALGIFLTIGTLFLAFVLLGMVGMSKMQILPLPTYDFGGTLP